MADNAMHKNPKSKQIRQIAISIATLTIAVVILLIFISCDSKQTDATPVPPPSPIVISEPAQTQLQKCTLFFFDTNSLRLAGEERELELELSQDVTERLKQTITELLNDSISRLYQTIPQGTLLYEVYVNEQSTAYLDFSHHLKDEHIGGTTSEALTIAAILRTVKMNFPDEIRKVQILIEGLETDTIGGHVDISKPLNLSLDLEVVSRQAESAEVESTEAEPTEAETLEAGQTSGQETDQ